MKTFHAWNLPAAKKEENDARKLTPTEFKNVSKLFKTHTENISFDTPCLFQLNETFIFLSI